jgi:hypothetical protein
MRPIVLCGIRLSPEIKRAFARANIDIYSVGSHAGNNGQQLIDIYGDFRRLYGMSGRFLCLIRPDGHIGLFQRPINEANIRDYLKLLGVGD